MNKLEMTLHMHKYYEIQKQVNEVATKYMKKLLNYNSPVDNTDGYSVFDLNFGLDNIRFKYKHYDGIVPWDREYIEIPFDFLFDSSKMDEHVKQYFERIKNKFDSEKEDRELFNKLKARFEPHLYGSPTILWLQDIK